MKPKVLLLFHGSALVIPPQLRSVLNTNEPCGISGLISFVSLVYVLSVRDVDATAVFSRARVG